MRLEFQHRHLSITTFPAIELPRLTVILGLNGSGKTHLLQAIQNGAVQNSIAPIQQPGGPGLGHPMPIIGNAAVRLLTNSQETGAPMNPANPGPITESTYTTSLLGQATPTATINFTAARAQILQMFVPRLETALHKSVEGLIGPKEDLWKLGIDDLIRRAQSVANRSDVEAVYRSAAEALENAGNSQSGRDPGAIMVAAALRFAPIAAKKLGISILAVTEGQARQYEGWGYDQFQLDLATLFGRYRDRQLRNQLRRLKDEAEGTSEALSEEAFINAFGPPPWISLTETFGAFGLPYIAAKPDVFEYTPVTFRLERADTGEEVRPSNLSSGERVLLQFAVSSYQLNDGLTNITRPQLLLLDELDAPLHPEMVHRWLRAINEGLVEGQGVTCILTTHSPTTVALAPEAALYEMRDGRSGLTKISKQDALNKLTFGVPTLSLDYSGRRQVFAESDTDAAIYEQVYSLIKSKIFCDRELNFLSTGMRTKDGGEINSGCTIVTSIVQSLHDAGNRAVYGIVDWDGSAVSTNRVKVIAEGRRDGIESVLLDPLLVCILLIKLRRAPNNLAGIDRFVGVDTLGIFDLQRMVDAVQHAAFPTSSSEKVEVEYIGGAKAKVLREYITINDHDLETVLVKAFPALDKWAKRGRGALVKAVVEEVLTEYRSFCPIELKTIFEDIANAT
jgi:energy-coupling factor transporter ATP-binding protein EcfA2